LIIAIKEKDKVVIGYTNLDSWGRLTNKDYVDEENLAIKFSKTGKVFACPNMNRRSDILLYDDELLNLDISPKSVVKEIIPYIKERLNENDIPIDKGDWKNALVICDNEHIYDIGPKFAFREAHDFVCHGYREAETIISVLDAMPSISAEQRIIKAVSFASKIYKENLFPLVITDTKDRKVKVVYEGEFENEHFDSV
jgi:hypothetical protein